jgi:plasmid maintenance system antidote protein VapI
MKEPAPMTGPLKKAIAAAGKSFLELERATGVQRASILRFMSGATSLRLDVADRLAAYFGLELRPRRMKG